MIRAIFIAYIWTLKLILIHKFRILYYTKYCLPAAIIVLACVASACSPGDKARLPTYYNLKAELEKQSAYLKDNKALAFKNSKINNSAPNGAEVNNPDWNRELALFMDLDICKPALIGRYKVDTIKHAKYWPGKPAEGSVGKSNEASALSEKYLVRYTALDEDLPVRSLKVSFTETGRVRFADGEILKNSILAYSKRKLAVTFLPEGKNNVLSTYRVSAMEKSLFSDTTRIELFGQIHVPQAGE
ncbi:MAG: hypothetical protein V4543_08355 [Bacteroidota bacterium]